MNVNAPRHRRHARAWIVVLISALLPLAAAPSALGRPKLVLQITVDQLRGDMPGRFRERFGPGGFRYLMDRGVHWINAHYEHSATYTGTGHATLFTGAHPAQHGIIGNDWYSMKLRQRINCGEDPDHRILGEPTRAHKGTSPRNLLCSTVGDELIIATGGKGRVFSVSIKDRGAILPAGRLGKAFWYSDKTGRFVTSTYYYEQYPEWAAQWNAARPADQYRNTQWTLLKPRANYLFGRQDDRPFERAYKDLGRTFPHPLGDDPDKFYASLRFTPMGDVLTLAFVKALIEHENVGAGETADFLAVSFSATDAIGHAFGPNSLEAEDNLLRLDRTLDDLLAYVDERVGLDDTLIVLSSDHGVDAAPEHMGYMHAAAQGTAGRLDPKRLIEIADAAARKHFGIDRDLVLAYRSAGLYLDTRAIRDLELDPARVEQVVASALNEVPGVAYTATRTDLMRGRAQDQSIMRMIQRSFHPQRSGHVMVIQRPSWYMHPKTVYSSMHGSPWSYDTYVPIILVGAGIEPRVVHRRVGPQDVAPTIAMILNVQPPSGTAGRPLAEAFGVHHSD
ncbi:MAG: alkaline phosphatase [Phycisphaeraceae bacterium]|nr:alkaline phosphatase [Phycisphaeraceae bacterium]